MNPFKTIAKLELTVAILLTVIMLLLLKDCYVETRAKNALDNVSPQLGNQYVAARNTTNDEAVRTQRFAEAHLANAQAEKASAEAQKIRTEIDVQKIGWTGVAFKEFGLQNLLCLICVLPLSLLLFGYVLGKVSAQTRYGQSEYR